MTREELNTELDYIICDVMNLTMDKLDSIPMEDLEILREAASILVEIGQ